MVQNNPVINFLDKAGIRSSQSRKEQLIKVVYNFSELPYENITKIIKFHQANNLDLARRLTNEVLEDFNKWHTGGTCFSLTSTLKEILNELSIESEIMMGDMKVGKNVHCALRATLSSGEDFLLDPGYLINQPLRLQVSIPTIHKTGMNTLIIEPTINQVYYDVFVLRNGNKKWRYRLHSKPPTDKDFVNYWNTSFSMNMNKALTISKASNDGQIYFSRSRLQFVNYKTRKTQNVRGREILTINKIFEINKSIIEQAHNLLNTPEKE